MRPEHPSCPRCGFHELWPERRRAVYVCDACDLEITEQELFELPADYFEGEEFEWPTD